MAVCSWAVALQRQDKDGMKALEKPTKTQELTNGFKFISEVPITAR
jgi:hypothetical protein